MKNDFNKNAVIRHHFNTKDLTTITGSPTLAVYKDGSVTETTNGLTLTVDLDGRTGYHLLVVDTTHADFTAGSDYSVIFTAGTTGGQSLVGAQIFAFSLENRSALRPTVPGRTLDVTSTGAAGIDWGNVENQNAVVDLDETSIYRASSVATVEEILDGVITSSVIADGALTAPKFAAGAFDGVRSSLGMESANLDTQLNNLGSTLVTIGSYIDTEVAAIKLIADKLDTTLEADGLVWRFTTNSVENVATGSGGGGTGTGARTVTITVTLASLPVEGARVRLTKGAETYIAPTNISGVIVFNVDDGSWVVSITSPGTSFAGATLVVDGTEAVTYQLTAITIPPSDPDKITGYSYCYDENNELESGVQVTIQCTSVPGLGMIFDSEPRTQISDVNGLVSFINLIPGTQYLIHRGKSKGIPFTVPAGPGDFEIPSFLGRERV